jgi:hypothetical protein
VGVAEALTVTAANITAPASVTVARVSGPAATIDPVPVTPAPGELTKLAYATAAAVGTLRLQASATISGSLVQSNAVDIVVSAAPTPPPPPPPPPPAAGTTITALALNATTTGTHPWACGHAFRQGDLPSGTSLAGVQCIVLTTWPDNSAKFAVLAGSTALTANVDATVNLTTGIAPAGAALTTANLPAMTAVIAGSVSGSATFTGADWVSPFRTVVTGPLMSSWVYRKTIDATLHAYVEVRLWAGGAVEVLPWLENGYVMVAGATSRNETWTFDLGGTQRESITLDFCGRQRLYLLTGTKLAHWLATDPDVFIRHSAAYIEATKLVPNYSATSPDSAITSWSESITSPHEQGLYPNGMGAGGYHLSIGLLPRWDAMVYTNGSRKAYRVAQQHAYRAGRYGVYYRDENTLSPPRLLDHATRIIGNSSAGIGDTGSGASQSATQTGSVPPTWKVSHLPSMGFVSALISGRWCHIETAQFNASLAMMHASTSFRQNGDGVLQTFSYLQVRGVAWALRAIAQAAAISPDDDPLQAEFERQLSNTAAFNHSRYVAQSSHPFGWMNSILPGLTDGYTPGTTPPLAAASWMQDFVTAAVGYARHLTGDGIAEAAKLAGWFEFLGKSVATRTTDDFSAAGYPYRYAGAFAFGTAAQDNANWNDGSGPWPATPGDMWRWTWAEPSGAESSFTALWSQQPGCSAPPTKELGDGSLLFGGIGSVGSYWHNLMPALSYCAEFGIPGAAAGYQRVVSAPNFASGVAAQDAGDPTWAVRARSTETWGAGSELGTLVGDVWTPGRDAQGRVNLASWNTVPTGRWIEVGGSRIDTQLTAAVQAVSAGWSLQQLWGFSNSSNLMQSWSGFTIDQANARLWFLGGGHSDGYNNGLYRFDFYRMQWAIECPPSPRSTMSTAYLTNGSSTNHPQSTATAAANFNANNAAGLTTGVLVPALNGPMYDEIPTDGKPTARHSYQGLVYVPTVGAQGSVFMHARRLWRYDIATGQWVLKRLVNDQIRSTGGAAPNATGVIEIHAAEQSLAIWDEATNRVLCSASGSAGQGAYAYNWNTQTWAGWSGVYGLNFNDAAVVRQGRTVVSFNAPAATGGRAGRYWVHNLDTGVTATGTDVQLGGGLTRANFQPADAFYDAYSMVYVPPLNRYWVWTRNNVGGMQALQLDPTTTPWTLSPLSFANASPIQERLAQGRTHWIEALNAVLVWDHCFVGAKLYKF